MNLYFILFQFARLLRTHIILQCAIRKIDTNLCAVLEESCDEFVSFQNTILMKLRYEHLESFLAIFTSTLVVI